MFTAPPVCSCAASCLRNYRTRNRGCSAHPAPLRPPFEEARTNWIARAKSSRENESARSLPTSSRASASADPGSTRRGRCWFAPASATFFPPRAQRGMGPGSRPGRHLLRGATLPIPRAIDSKSCTTKTHHANLIDRRTGTMFALWVASQSRHVRTDTFGGGYDREQREPQHGMLPCRLFYRPSPSAISARCCS